MKETHTKHHPIRVDADLWETFGQLVGTRNRSAVIREFIRWFVREHGARLPARPGAEEFGYPGDDRDLLERLIQARNEMAHGSSSGTTTRSFNEAEGLSPMELQLLFLVTENLAYAEIAEALNVAPGEAKAQVENVAAKIRAAGGVRLHVSGTKRGTRRAPRASANADPSVDSSDF